MQSEGNLQTLGIVQIDGDLKERELVRLMRATEVPNYLSDRRLQVAGPTKAGLGLAMGIAKTAAVDILAGRKSFGEVQMERFNSVDPDFELIFLIGVFKKKVSPNGAPHPKASRTARKAKGKRRLE